MISRELGALLKPIVRNQMIIWGAFTAACFFYVGLAFVIGTNQMKNDLIGSDTDPLAEGLSDTVSSALDLSFIFYGVAILLGIGAFMYNRYALSDQKLVQQLTGDPADTLPGPFGSANNPTRDNKYASLSVGEKKILSLVVYGQRTTIISLAICEAIAVLGLVLVFLEGRAAEIVPFVAVTIILNFFFMPRPIELLKRADALVRSG